MNDPPPLNMSRIISPPEYLIFVHSNQGQYFYQYYHPKRSKSQLEPYYPS
jgi:hypothetical protein